MLVTGYVLVATLFYGLGQYNTAQKPPAVQIQKQDLSRFNDTLKHLQTQLAEGQSTVAGATTVPADPNLNCEGKIKGNISSSSKIYHIPGGSFYKRTNPEACFDSETQAQAAGFRKSKQ